MNCVGISILLVERQSGKPDGGVALCSKAESTACWLPGTVGRHCCHGDDCFQGFDLVLMECPDAGKDVSGDGCDPAERRGWAPVPIVAMTGTHEGIKNDASLPEWMPTSPSPSAPSNCLRSSKFSRECQAYRWNLPQVSASRKSLNKNSISPHSKEIMSWSGGSGICSEGVPRAHGHDSGSGRELRREGDFPGRAFAESSLSNFSAAGLFSSPESGALGREEMSVKRDWPFTRWRSNVSLLLCAMADF